MTRSVGFAVVGGDEGADVDEDGVSCGEASESVQPANAPPSRKTVTSATIGFNVDFIGHSGHH
jgi:hypothetical protein